MRTLDRLLLAELTRIFCATLAGVVALYLLIDYADRSHGFSGPGWPRAAAELYANKAAIVTYQIAPGALVIAAALLVAVLARRGELDALFALGLSSLRLLLPVAAFAALVGVLIFALGEAVVVRAGARAEEIDIQRFGRWGEFSRYHAGSSWVRGAQGRIFHLGSPREGGFEPVTVLELSPRFHLARRIDARRIEPAGPGRWRLLEAVELRFGAGLEVAERRLPEMVEAFPDKPSDLALRSGRPQTLGWLELREQARRRARLGQPTAREYQLALAERAAQPLQSVPAALAAFALSLRRRSDRRAPRPLASAIALGLGLSLALWAASIVARAAALSGTLAPAAAAFAAAGLSAALAAAALWVRPR